jgi:hypothetical protein
MRKRRIERNLAFPTEEFRMRVRTAAKERGFRTEQAFIIAACQNELERGDTTEATTQLEARIAATLANVTKEVQSLFTLVHTQVALTNSLLQYVLTCIVEPPRGGAVCGPRTGKAQIRKDSSPSRAGRSDSKQGHSRGGIGSWQTTVRKAPSICLRRDQSGLGRQKDVFQVP